MEDAASLDRPHEVEVSVVIPCLNEAATIGACIDAARLSLGQLQVNAEIVVADNGSLDVSREIAADRGARVVEVASRGYGNALSAGIEASRGRYVIMGDGDGSYDFGGLAPFVEQLRAGNDLVVGNRFAGGIHPEAMPWLHQHLGNPVLSLIGRKLFGTNCGDIYCGLRGFDRRKIIDLDIRSAGMEFAIEMIVKATVRNLNVTEVPTTLSPDAEGRKPHLRTWRDGWRSLRLLLLYSPRWLFLYPGIALLVAGLVGTVLLVPGQRTIGSVTFDVSTLLYACLAVIVGLQSVYFFLSARWFAMNEGFLPEDERLRRLLGPNTLEIGLAVGVLLLVSGIGLSVYGVGRWNETGFGRLDYADILRIVIPAATLIAVGLQTLLSSLFLSVLGLSRR
ncbi:MAG: glycosyltransferase family 2 protein [Chloroflexi bacterium]|nr:glycosyltransferase family 2 protein [Chloroflexota bacterium]